MAEGTNLDLILSTDYLSIDDEKILQEENEANKITLGEGISLAIQQEQILPSLLKSYSRPELEPNYDFRLDDETFDELSKDIDPQYWDEFSNATSLGQAYQIKQRILDSQEANKKLSTLGFTGTALRLGAAILDPTALVADAVTFGFARPFIYANKAARYSKYFRSGLVGAGQASLITAPVVLNDPTRDIEEIGYAALMGGAITSGLTRFMGPKNSYINDFDAKAKDLGRSIEKTNLKNDGYKLTDKGEKYFGPDKPVTPSIYIDEVDELLPTQGSIKPTKSNKYSPKEKEIVTSLKDDVGEIDIPIPKKFVAGDSIEFFDDAGRKVKRKVVSVSGSGRSVKVKINNKEKIISLEEGSSDFINFKNPGYVFRAAGTNFQRKSISELKKQELEDLRIDLQGKKRQLETEQATNQGVYKDVNKDLKAVEYSLNVLPEQQVDDVIVNFFDRLDVTPNVAFAKARGDKSSVLRRSESPFMRSMSEKFAEEAVGNVDSSRSIITADLVKHNYAMTTETLFYKNYAPAFEKFMKEVKGKKLVSKYVIQDRLEFSNLVARAVRGEIIDVPGVAEGALATRKVLKKILDDLKKEGVEGAAEVLENPNYFPRKWSIGRMQDMQEKIPYNKLINFLKNSLVRGSQDLSDVDGLRIAKHIYKVVNTNKFGDGFSIDRLLYTTDADDLRTLITDYANLDAGEVEDLVQALLKPGRGKPTAVPRLRRRASFDENYEETIDGFKIKFTDLLDNNTEGLMGSYIEQMSGQIALARIGIKSRQDYTKILNKVKESYEIPEIAKKYSTGVGKKRKAFELETLDTIYKNIIGIPTEKNIQGAASTVMRNLRKYNYVNVFNQVGFSQIPEMGNVVNAGGIRAMVKYMPEFRKIMSRAKDGKLNNEFLDEIETLVSGTGSNRLVDSTINRTDDFAGVTTKVGKIEKTLDVAARVTSDFSGFHAVDMASRRLAAITSFDKLAMYATGRLKLTDAALKRYRNIGFSDSELQGVFQSIKKNATFIEGGLTGRKIRRFNIDQWEDQDLANKMSLYMSRHIRRVVQENNYGEMLAIGTDSGLGKTMLQFRNFVITAYSKQLLHGLHMRDFTAFASAMTSTFIAGLVYVAQTHIQAIGKSPEEKQDFLDKRLSYLSIGSAAFQRSTYSTLLPTFVDTIRDPFGAEPLFNYRSSGLEINLVTGNPTYRLFEKGYGALKSIGTAIVDDEYDFSKQSLYKLKAIAPYQNMLGFTNILQYLIDDSDLPDKPK
nr:putative internal virion protein [uncultured Mediterranean phage uvMED]